MAILGGSPLGLIGVLSTPSRDGMSTFNAGKSRNVNINKYNTGKATEGSSKAGMVSLFSGGSQIKAWANVGAVGTAKDTSGLKDDFKGTSRTSLHNNDVYDTSLLNIIEKLSSTSAALRPSDFAYLKNLGVYPNNRLIIARRFASPLQDNIIGKRILNPQSVMITWRPPDEDFFDISFSEEWEDAEADFTSILNSMGEDFLGKNAGGKAGAALGGIPLPGFTEQMQRTVLEKLGVLDELPKDANANTILPAGNPNIIKMAKKRKTIPQGSKGSGLKCTFQVKMVCEYEQKFISGIDPTIVWQDLLGNILRFGTSVSGSYGLSAGFAAKAKGWASNPQVMIDEFVGALTDIVGDVVDGVTKAIQDIKTSQESKKGTTKAVPKVDTGAALEALGDLKTELVSSLAATVLKYKHDIYGVINNLSGAPSTPWHVTLGNPLRPVFCSGDMLVEDVKLSTGADLAFNDLPSRVKVEFTMKNARPWGLQEIAAKFATGHIRSVNTIKDNSTLTPGQTLHNSPLEFPADPATENSVVNTESNGESSVSNTTAGDNNSNSGVTTENKTVEVINPEAGAGADVKAVITEGETNTQPPLTPEQIETLSSIRLPSF
jgi:hypothetical protein